MGGTGREGRGMGRNKIKTNNEQWGYYLLKPQHGKRCTISGTKCSEEMVHNVWNKMFRGNILTRHRIPDDSKANLTKSKPGALFASVMIHVCHCIWKGLKERNNENKVSAFVVLAQTGECQLVDLLFEEEGKRERLRQCFSTDYCKSNAW